MALPDWVIVSGIITSALGSVVLTIKAKPEARKLDRDGSAAAITAGGGIITEVHQEMQELRAELREIRLWRKGVDAWWRKHSRWDQQMVNDARAQGRSVPDPPPLYEDEVT